MDVLAIYKLSLLITVIADVVGSAFGVILWKKLTPGFRTITVLVVLEAAFGIVTLGLIVGNVYASRSWLAVSALVQIMFITIATFQMGKDVYINYVYTLLRAVLVIYPLAFCAIAYFFPEWLKSDYISIFTFSLIVFIVGEAMAEYYRYDALYASLSEYWVYAGLFMYYLGLVILWAISLVKPPQPLTLFWLPHAILAVVKIIFISRSFYLESLSWNTQLLPQQQS